MNSNKILIYGIGGYLGEYLANVIKNEEKFKFEFSAGLSQLEDRKLLIEEIKTLKPSRIIILPERSDEFWRHSHQNQDARENVVGQLNLIDVADQLGIHCTVINSGAIYQYDNEHPVYSGKAFTEVDEPNFDKFFYFQMRIMLEKLTKSYKNLLCLRLTNPTTHNLDENSIITELLSSDKVKSIPITVSLLDDVFPVMLDMIQKSVVGTFNLNNPGVISHDDILKLYKSNVDESYHWKVLPYDLNQSGAELSAQKLLDLGYTIPKVQDSIKSIMSKLSHQKSRDMNIDCVFYENLAKKNILITGGAGFIASHVAILLTQKYKNYNIFVYDVLDYCSNIKNLDSVKDEPNFRFIKGDICDFNMVKFIMEEFKIDCVLHFAAQSHVDISLKNSLKFTQTNVLGTHVLLECGRQCNIKRFIHVSTDEVYGTTDTEADINQALEPTNPYACSKLAAECIIKAYQKCFKMPIIISRGNNVYGPHQFLEKVIPKFISRLLRDKKCCIHDDGTSERDFLFVGDVAAAFDLLLHKGQPGLFYNIGASKSITILELAKKLVQQIKHIPAGREEEYIEFVNGRILDDKRYKIDSSRIISLGWRQKIDFDEGLKKTIEWYSSNLDYWSNADYALEPHPFSLIKE